MHVRILVSIFSFLFIVLPFEDSAEAKKNYKYKDENGVLNFSDRPPLTRRPVKVEQVYVKGRDRRVSIADKGSNKKPDIYVNNLYAGPIEIEFNIIERKNITLTPELPLKLVIPSMKERKVFSIRPEKKSEGWRYRYSSRYVFGDPSAIHSPSKPYRPPFGLRMSLKISQSFKGKYSHTEPFSEYAVDIAMPEGTHIHAARSGIVMDIANDFFTGGSDVDKYGERANLVRILHDDGTMGVYAHLKLESVRFGIGMRVEEGVYIAESGNTGFSTGPHLHFVIQKNIGMNIVSIPFQFEGVKGKGLSPELGMVLEVPR